MTDILKHLKIGLNGTLNFKNGTSLSHHGTAIPVFTNTVVDKFFVGDFSSAKYMITVEAGSNKKETMEVMVAARPGEASVVVYGKSYIDRELVTLSGTVNDSHFILTASIIDEANAGAKLIFFANYAEAHNQLTPSTTKLTPVIPASYASTANVTFLPVISNTGFSSPNFAVDTTGTLAASTINASTINVTTLSVNGNSVVTAPGGILPSSITSSSLTQLGTLTSLTVQGNVTVSGGTVSIVNQNTSFGLVDGVNIGTNLPGNGNFSNLTAPSITINQPPTSANHATTKQYVDSKVSALAIALGS